MNRETAAILGITAAMGAIPDHPRGGIKLTFGSHNQKAKNRKRKAARKARKRNRK